MPGLGGDLGDARPHGARPDDRDPHLAGVAGKLNAARDYLLRAALVVRTARTLELPALATALPRTPPDAARLAELAARWGIGGSLTRAVTAIAGPAAAT